MISKKQVDAAVAAAKEELNPDGDFTWVRKSALMERAYHVGLYAGLRAIAREDDLEGPMLRALVNTMFPRDGDDSFDSTPLGREFNKLKKRVLDGEASTLPPEVTDAMTSSLEDLDRRWTSTLSDARRLIVHIQHMLDNRYADTGKDDSLRHEYYGLFQELEHLVRLASLLQVDHRKWNGLLE
jgi:hypothetical protein